MKRMIYLLYLPFFCCSGIDSNKNTISNNNLKTTIRENISPKNSISEYSDLGKLFSRYGKSKVFVSLYFIDSKSLKGIHQQIDSSNVYYCDIIGFFEKKLNESDSLVESTERYFKNLKDSVRNQILSKVTLWLKNDILLSSVLDNNLGNDIFFEEIIDKIDETKPLIKKYLKHPDQYWGSLDLNQSCKLFYDVNHYLLTLGADERIFFLKKYFVTACDLTLRKKTQ